jgi:uncharacterized membrane protein YdjX (TVP38/TMEM64 family)
MTPEILGQLAIFGGIAFGVLFGLPVMPFFIAAGAMWGIEGLPIVLLALLIHFFASYYIARGILRPLAEKFFKKFESKMKLPDAATIGPIKLILLVRMIPGIPLVAVSYGLAALWDIPVMVYVFVSLFTQLFWATASMLVGASLMKNSAVMLVCACAVFAILIVISRNYARRTQAR